MKKEFIENMLQAKRYELKAIYCLLPEHVRQKMRIKGKELLQLTLKYGMELMREEDTTKEEGEKRARKVTID